MSAPPKTSPTARPAAAWAAAPARRLPIQASRRPSAAYSSPFNIPRMGGEAAEPGPAATPSAYAALFCSVRATVNAAGAASSPDMPVHAACPFEAALPKASPEQTTIDQEIFPTRSATSALAPGVVLKIAWTARSTISTAMPTPTASQAICRTVARRSPSSRPAASVGSMRPPGFAERPATSSIGAIKSTSIGQPAAHAGPRPGEEQRRRAEHIGEVPEEEGRELAAKGGARQAHRVEEGKRFCDPY